MVRITAFELLPEYRLHLRFSDGFEVIRDIRPLLDRGIALDLQNPSLFSQAFIDRLGGICWPNGYDISADFLRFTEAEYANAIHRESFSR